MDYLTRLLDIHNGILILPFMNYPDILSLMKCSLRIYHIYIIYKQPYSFYGLPLPKEKGIWFDIFYQRYTSLEEALQLIYNNFPDNNKKNDEPTGQINKNIDFKIKIDR